MTSDLTIAAYYYPGWHSCPVRDANFSKGWSEWDLVYDCRPGFEGHEQPNIPLWGRLNEADPCMFHQKIRTASDYGVNTFVFAFYWSRGKRLLQDALDWGYLGCCAQKDVSFALMWANRMPRKVMPVKDPDAALIDPTRLVHTDPDDFVDFIEYVGGKYFTHPNYFRIGDAVYLSIFDTNFFLRQLGVERAQSAIARARTWLREQGIGELHLAAIDPIPDFQPLLKEIGFDSITHYVFLPEWKGPRLQDFEQMASQRVKDWNAYAPASGLPYFPSVSPGWDANPRALDYGKEKPGRYPWSPVITGRSPEKFEGFLQEAVAFTRRKNPQNPLCFISSWNEWSEGHYLEPDERYEYAWLEAVRNCR